jgi:hypothetical protein
MARLANQYFANAAASGSNSIFPLVAMIQLAYKSRGEPDPAWVKEAKRRLQDARPWAPNMVALNNIVNCQMTQYCRLEDGEITALLLSALANPHAPRTMQGTAHSLLGGYYAVKVGNAELGLTHMKAAVEAEPSRIEYRLDLMRMYETVRNFAAARVQLDIARGLDEWRLQRERFDVESALLDAAVSGISK